MQEVKYNLSDLEGPAGNSVGDGPVGPDGDGLGAPDGPIGPTGKTEPPSRGGRPRKPKGQRFSDVLNRRILENRRAKLGKSTKRFLVNDDLPDVQSKPEC